MAERGSGNCARVLRWGTDMQAGPYKQMRTDGNGLGVSNPRRKPLPALLPSSKKLSAMQVAVQSRLPWASQGALEAVSLQVLYCPITRGDSRSDADGLLLPAMLRHSRSCGGFCDSVIAPFSLISAAYIKGPAAACYRNQLQISCQGKREEGRGETAAIKHRHVDVDSVLGLLCLVPAGGPAVSARQHGLPCDSHNLSVHGPVRWLAMRHQAAALAPVSLRTACVSQF